MVHVNCTFLSHTCPLLFMVTGKLALEFNSFLWSILSVLSCLTLVHGRSWVLVTVPYHLTIVHGFSVVTGNYDLPSDNYPWSLLTVFCHLTVFRGQ